MRYGATWMIAVTATGNLNQTCTPSCYCYGELWFKRQLEMIHLGSAAGLPSRPCRSPGQAKAPLTHAMA